MYSILWKTIGRDVCKSSLEMYVDNWMQVGKSRNREDLRSYSCAGKRLEWLWAQVVASTIRGGLYD